MSLLPFPTSVINCIEKLQIGFSWGRMGEELKFHLVNRPKAYLNSKCGSSNRKLVTFNQTPPRKWLRRYAPEIYIMWRELIDTKYDSVLGNWSSMNETMTLDYGKTSKHVGGFCDISYISWLMAELWRHQPT